MPQPTRPGGVTERHDDPLITSTNMNRIENLRSAPSALAPSSIKILDLNNVQKRNVYRVVGDGASLSPPACLPSRRYPSKRCYNRSPAKQAPPAR